MDRAWNVARRHLSSTAYGKEDIKVIVVLCEKLKENLRREGRISFKVVLVQCIQRVNKRKRTKNKTSTINSV